MNTHDEYAPNITVPLHLFDTGDLRSLIVNAERTIKRAQKELDRRAALDRLRAEQQT
jgi:hypothetical protein